MYCDNCGNKLLEGAKFCNNCGKSQSVSVQQPQEPQQQEQAAYQPQSNNQQTAHETKSPGGSVPLRSAFRKIKKMPVIFGATGVLAVIVIIIAVVASNGSGGYTPSYTSSYTSRDKESYTAEAPITRNPVKTIRFTVKNNTDGTINSVYVNNQVIWTGYISPGSSSVISFECNTDIIDVSNTNIKFDIYGSFTGITESPSWRNIDFTENTVFRLEEPESWKYELYTS